MGAHRHDNEKVLSVIKNGVLFAFAISAVGQFCHRAQCSYCSVELNGYISVKLAHYIPYAQSVEAMLPLDKISPEILD